MSPHLLTKLLNQHFLLSNLNHLTSSHLNELAVNIFNSPAPKCHSQILSAVTLKQLGDNFVTSHGEREGCLNAVQ